MKVIKFTINEDYYEQFKILCSKDDITVKRKLNVLVSQDAESTDIKEYFPSDYNEKMRKVTLKINEEIYKGIMKKCGKLDLKVNKYVSYLIYRYLHDMNIK
jgi:hypothetical protein